MMFRTLLLTTLAGVFAAVLSARQVPQPGSDATLFAPGGISTGAYELTTTFTPDGETAFYTVSLPEYGRKRFIIEAALTGAKWVPTRVAPFSGLYDDADPFVTADGRHLFFLSKRPVTGTARKPDLDIWVVDRVSKGWSEPRHLGMRVNGPGDEHYVTVASDGSLYISAVRPNGSGRGDIYRVPYNGGEYAEPVSLGPVINTPAHETTPYVAPDQSYIIFGSSGRPDAAGRGIDLYISFRTGDSWTPPENLGPRINSVADDYCPIVSPDGSRLYFSSERSFAEEQAAPVSDWNQLRELLSNPGNSLGDVYFVEMSQVRAAVGRR